MCNRDKVGAWEIFDVISHGVASLSLRASNGQYVCAESVGGKEVVANRSQIGGWEIFNLQSMWQGNIVSIFC